MTTKQIVRQVIKRLPENATLDDVMHALYIRAKFERGEREIKEGRGISHEEAKRRLRKWVK